jgi:hypothetical protein
LLEHTLQREVSADLRIVAAQLLRQGLEPWVNQGV